LYDFDILYFFSHAFGLSGLRYALHTRLHYYLCRATLPLPEKAPFATDASVPFSLRYGGGFLNRFASAADECGVALQMLIKAYCQASATRC
jgi:hypothetical protein